MSDPTTRVPQSPILVGKDYRAASIFQPEALLREARRQKSLPLVPVPNVCVLDPDGDIVRHLKQTGAGKLHLGWACYHTEMHVTELEGIGAIGVVGCAVGSSFAVLVAEQLFASGCSLLVSVTSAGQITDSGPTPYFVLIDSALRDEGTSYHYLAPSAFVAAPDATLLGDIEAALDGTAITLHRGASWTTDAPYRETEQAVEAARAEGILAVEMEAAALYAFAQASGNAVVCFAHVTNSMAQSEGDFEKGEQDGVTASLAVIRAAAVAFRSARQSLATIHP